MGSRKRKRNDDDEELELERLLPSWAYTHPHDKSQGFGSMGDGITSGRRWYARENGILGLRVAIVAPCST